MTEQRLEGKVKEDVPSIDDYPSEVTDKTRHKLQSTHNMLLSLRDTNEQHEGDLNHPENDCITRVKDNYRLNASYKKMAKKVKRLITFEENTGQLKDAFMPMYWGLRVVGLVYIKNKHKWFSLSKIHSISIVALIWANVLQISFSYDKTDGYSSKLMVKIMAHLWCLQIAVGTTLFLMQFRINIPMLLQAWDEYRDIYIGISIALVRRTVRKIVLIFWIFYIIFFISTLTVFFTKHTYLNEMTICFTAHLFRDSRLNPFVIQSIFQIVFLYSISLYMLPVVILCMLCNLLRNEYNNVTAKLRAYVIAEDSLDYIEDVRQQHLTLTNIIDKLDDIMSLFLLNVYLLDVPMVCFNMYVMMSSSKGNLSTIVQMFSFIISVIHVMVVTCAGGSLTVAVSCQFVIHCVSFCVFF